MPLDKSVRKEHGSGNAKGVPSQSPGLARGTSAYPGVTDKFLASTPQGLRPPVCARFWSHTYRSLQGCKGASSGTEALLDQTKELLNHAAIAAIVICCLPAFDLLHQRTSPVLRDKPQRSELHAYLGGMRCSGTNDTYGIEIAPQHAPQPRRG